MAFAPGRREAYFLRRLRRRFIQTMAQTVQHAQHPDIPFAVNMTCNSTSPSTRSLRASLCKSGFGFSWMDTGSFTG